MELHEVEVLINKYGQVTLHIRGTKGNECLVLTEDIEKLLGGEIVLRTMTVESAETSQITAPQRQKVKKLK